MSKNCRCSKCTDHDDFDAKAAYLRLSRKYTRLADTMARYMSEAGLKKKERVANALEMAETMAIFNGSDTDNFKEACIVKNQKTCSGVLVHPRIVLSAAHCATPGITKVFLNGKHINDPAVEEIRVKEFHPHPLHVGTGTHDIAVLILRDAATTPFVRIATTTEFEDAFVLHAVGFGDREDGSTGEKRVVRLEKHQHADIEEAEDRFDFESNREFTAGGGGFDTCDHDSGGPVYIGDGANRLVCGLTSRSMFPRQPCGEGGIYTLIDAHREFIRGVAQNNHISFP